jgi:hypothetical protein
MVGQQLNIDGNKASSIREADGYRISIIVERLDGQAIAQDEAQVILTGNVPTMFTQRMSFGGRSR